MVELVSVLESERAHASFCSRCSVFK